MGEDDVTAGLTMAGPATVHVVSRIQAAVRKLLAEGYAPIDLLVIHIEQSLWMKLLAEQPKLPLGICEGKIAGLEAVRDNTLNTDQIRLRFEVMA